MSELLSVGLDVGTTTTQMIVSKLRIENKASGFAVPQMEIIDRKVIYRGPVRFTPLVDESHIDGQALRKIVEEEYAAAKLRRQDVGTGGVIITGETSRKENARVVLEMLSDFAGEFVVATAGPHLESVLAAKGSGAVAYSRRTGKTVLHMDIGGGTSNLALIQNGEILRTGCLNIGGRLVKFDGFGRVCYCSKVLQGLWETPMGEVPSVQKLEELALLLARGLEMAAGLRKADELLNSLMTQEATPWVPPEEKVVISFSGGVADCIGQTYASGAFGDIGTLLGEKIRNSLLCQGEYILGQETIRATVIGAGCYSTQLSGSTVFYRNVSLPLKNLPVAVITKQEQDAGNLPEVISQKIARSDGETVVLSLPGYVSPHYSQISELADKIAAGSKGSGVYIALEADMAKALGHALQLRLGKDKPCLCIDRVLLEEDSFLDVGEPVGPCLPVVIKTLVLSKKESI